MNVAFNASWMKDASLTTLGSQKAKQESSCVNYAIPTDLLVFIISQKMTILGIEEHR